MKAKFIAAMKRLNTVMKNDNAAGHQWRYYNNKRSESTFEATRKAGKYYTNCMGGVSFAAKEAGIPAAALDWYGGRGKIVWLNKNAEKNCRKYFDIIAVRSKTVKQCIEKGILQPGDVVTYMTITHTNAYYADNRSFDSGHAYCSGSGEGAAYKKWIGTTPYKGYKVAYILRPKTAAMYRVQVGAYTEKANADSRVLEVKGRSGFDCFTEHTDIYRVYCGSFTNKANAESRAADLAAAGVEGAFIKEFPVK